MTMIELSATEAIQKIRGGEITFVEFSISKFAVADPMRTAPSAQGINNSLEMFGVAANLRDTRSARN